MMMTQRAASGRDMRMLTVTAALSAISFLLAFFEFPVPLSPPFARMDLSDLPALIGAFSCGPVTGVLIELIKNLLQLSTTGPADCFLRSIYPIYQDKT